MFKYKGSTAFLHIDVYETNQFKIPVYDLLESMTNLSLFCLKDNTQKIYKIYNLHVFWAKLRI